MITVQISYNEQHFMPTSHFHEYYELYFLISGDVTHFVHENVYRVTDGEVVIVSPMVLHRTTMVNSKKRTRAILCFTANELEYMEKAEPGVTDYLKNGVVSCGKSGFSQIETVLDKLQNEQQNENNHLMKKAYLYEILIMLKRQSQSTINMIKQSNESIDKRIHSVIKYLNENYSDAITLEKLAERFYVSPAYLSRRFKKTTGFTYVEYLVNLRVKKATEYLEKTDRTITEIAVSTGFGSGNHFCKTFKKIMGVSPLEYRKKHRCGIQM